MVDRPWPTDDRTRSTWELVRDRAFAIRDLRSLLAESHKVNIMKAIDVYIAGTLALVRFEHGSIAMNVSPKTGEWIAGELSADLRAWLAQQNDTLAVADEITAAAREIIEREPRG